MFEVSFNVDLKERYYIDFLYDGLKEKIKKANGIVFCGANQDRVFISIACEDCFAVEIKSEIYDLLAEIYALGFKHFYLRKNLYIYKDNLLSKTLINTMTIFDGENDKKLIKKCLFNQNIGAIDGFFYFRMKKVKEKWDEIIDLTNENAIVLHDKETSCEFLSFLIDAMQTNDKTVVVFKEKDSFKIKDEKGCLVDFKIPFWKKQVDEEVVLFNLVRLAPQKVDVVGEKVFSKDFVYIIKRFF